MTGPLRPPDTFASSRPPLPRPAPAQGTRPAPKPQKSPQQLALEQAQAYWQPVIDEYHRQQQQLALQHAAEQAGLGALYSTLGGSFAGIGDQFKSIYDRAGQNIAKYATDADNRDLATYQGGLAGEGSAYGTGSIAYPQLAGQQGVLAFLKAVQDAHNSESNLAGQLNQVTAKIPGTAQDIQAQAAKAAQPILRSVGGSVVSIDPQTGRTQVLYQTPAKPQAPARLQLRTLANGQVQAVDPYTGRPVGRPFGMPRATKPGKLAQQKINGQVYNVDPASGALTLAPGNPGGSAGKKVILGLSGVPLTKGQIGTFTKDVYGMIGNARKGGSFETLLDGLKNSPIPPALWRPLIARAYKIPTGAGDLRHMSVPRLHNIAVFYGYQPGPEKLNKQGLIGWIQAHAPKDRAAQGAAINAAYVTRAPGMDRAGVATRPQVVDFVGKIGRIYGQKLTIGTGSNHSQYVSDRPGHESDHWFGDAADIPMSGVALTRLGQAALIAAGADPKWARQQQGGVYNIGGYNILFNTSIGGNHWNHLHVGLGRILGRTFA